MRRRGARIRMQVKAMRQRKNPPLLMVIRSETGKFDQIVFVRPDHLDEMKAQYGDRLIDFLGEEA